MILAQPPVLRTVTCLQNHLTDFQKLLLMYVFISCAHTDSTCHPNFSFDLRDSDDCIKLTCCNRMPHWSNLGDDLFWFTVSVHHGKDDFSKTMKFVAVGGCSRCSHHGWPRRRVKQELGARNILERPAFNHLLTPWRVYLLKVPQSPQIVSLVRKQAFKTCVCRAHFRSKP